MATPQNTPSRDDFNDGELISETVDMNTLAVLNRSEIDMQIATAKRFPRSIKNFRDESLQMVTLDEEIAEECIYALPRKEKNQQTGEWTIKTIEGPSARFAEIILSAWGNVRAGSRVVSEEGEFVTAQGAFYDLERNVAINYEVKRRIIDKQGRRFSSDMVGVTANAACSIALRNAICKGIPKAFWKGIYDRARATAAGTYETLANRRSKALESFVIYGVKAEKIYETLGVKGKEDITIEHLVALKGMLNAIKDGDTTPELLFNPQPNTGKNVRAEQAGKTAVENLAAIHTNGTSQPKKEGSGVASDPSQAPVSHNNSAPPTPEPQIQEEMDQAWEQLGESQPTTKPSEAKAPEVQGVQLGFEDAKYGDG